MEQFTASNGVVVLPAEPGVADLAVGNSALYEHEAEALREFFRAVEDKRLGRWRWPENPDYVLYPTIGGHNVLDEGGGNSFFVHADHRSPEHYGGDLREAVKAVDAYFDAHSEPKPWHEAKPWETWLVTIDPGYSDNSWMHITAARRDLPEENA